MSNESTELRLGENRELQAAVRIAAMSGERDLPERLCARVTRLKAAATKLIAAALRQRKVTIGGDVVLSHEVGMSGMHAAPRYRLRRLQLETGYSSVMAVVSRIRSDGVPSVREASWPVDAVRAGSGK